MDTYYSRTEVSNSDLSWLQNQLYPREMPDPTQAYRMGSLIDAMITEPARVNFLTRRLDGDQFSSEDFERAEKMKRAFLTDDFCVKLLDISQPQKVMARRLELSFHGIDFFLNMRCKWDFWFPALAHGADLKSTTATTQGQFEASITHFEYDRQRAVYMTIADAEKDVLIGISKVNFKVFKVFINRKSELYQSGMYKFLKLAYHWNNLFGEDKSALTKSSPAQQNKSIQQQQMERFADLYCDASGNCFTDADPGL
jgi:hypothetical protein